MGVQNVEQVVRNILALGGGNFRRSDIETAIQLERIAVHDFAAEGTRNMHSESAFPGAGGADNGYERRVGGHVQFQL